MNDHYVINLGRQLGSGGKEIGEKLAKALNIAFYDKELIQLASDESGLNKEFLMLAYSSGMFQRLGSLCGGDNTVPAAFKNGKPQFLLQRANRIADAGVGHMQFFCRLRNGTAAVYFQNILQLLNGHGSSPLSLITVMLF
jgi:hypothetical protein